MGIKVFKVKNDLQDVLSSLLNHARTVVEVRFTATIFNVNILLKLGNDEGCEIQYAQFALW